MNLMFMLLKSVCTQLWQNILIIFPLRYYIISECSLNGFWFLEKTFAFKNVPFDNFANILGTLLFIVLWTLQNNFETMSYFENVIKKHEMNLMFMLLKSVCTQLWQNILIIFPLRYYVISECSLNGFWFLEKTFAFTFSHLAHFKNVPFYYIANIVGTLLLMSSERYKVSNVPIWRLLLKT